MRAILPHVDEFRAAHNLASFADLVSAIGGTSPAKQSRYVWQGRAA
jgi:uncharacterized protein with von Willebrand factor type A (vWA) domain